MILPRYDYDCRLKDMVENPNYWLVWNGSKLKNEIKAKLQTMEILDPEHYKILGHRLFREILHVIEEQNTPSTWGPLRRRCIATGVNKT